MQGGGDSAEGAQGVGEDSTKRTKGGDNTEKAEGGEEEEDPQEEGEEEGVLTEPAGSAGPRQGSAAWSKDRYIRDDEDQAI